MTRVGKILRHLLPDLMPTEQEDLISTNPQAQAMLGLLVSPPPRRNLLFHLLDASVKWLNGLVRIAYQTMTIASKTKRVTRK